MLFPRSGIAVASAFFAMGQVAVGQIAPPRLVRTPDIHGEQVVFSAEGDIWLGSIKAGTAQRITTDDGNELQPRFSPDGSMIAFTGGYEDGREVYVMPTQGGIPRRLTFSQVGSEMIGWTPDGKQVLVRSRKQNPTLGTRLYTVPVSGGTPTALPMYKAGQGSFSPDGSKIAFTRLSMETHRWKRYQGGEANHIYIGDLSAKQYERINREVGNEMYPVWVGDKIFFVSERAGTANIWEYSTTTKKSRQVTFHEGYDVKAPWSDGTRLIYGYGDELWILDLKTGKDERLKLQLVSDKLHARPHFVAGSISEMTIGPTGKRIAATSRGQLFSVPAERGEIRTISPFAVPGIKEPAWSPDGKQIAFISDADGEQNVWVVLTSGDLSPKKLTNDSRKVISQPVWAPNSKALLYSDSTLTVWMIDIATGSRTEVAKTEYDPISDYSFSPDSKWIAYSKRPNFFSQTVWLYNVASKQSTPLTKEPTRDSQPTFDPTGKYLFFLSERSIQPRWDGVDFQMNCSNTTKVFGIALAEATMSPYSADSDEEVVAPKEDKPEKPAAPVDVKVDLAGIGERLFELPLPGGNYRGLAAVSAEKVLLINSENPGEPGTLLSLELKEKKRPTELAQGVNAFVVTADRKKMAVLSSNGLQIADVDSPVEANEGKVDLSGWKVAIDPETEWKVIFEQAWRQHRDVFYDPNMHGMDWDGVRKKYEAILPSIGCRAELTELIGEMQGELNVSHEFGGGGATYPTRQSKPEMGVLGADIEWDSAAGLYRIAKIYGGDGFSGDNRSPLIAPGLGVKTGTYLFSINGTKLTRNQDPQQLLIGQAGKTVVLKVSDMPSESGAKTIRVRPMNSDAQARYYDWVETCRSYVKKNGGANIGYVHLPDMGEAGMAELSKHLYNQLEMDGIVVDVRYNGGGITSGMVLERLRRTIFEYDQARVGKPVPYHRMGYPGKLIVLCNENTGSDGEYFCTGFRMMKLGPTVGARTWGGFMAVNGFPTIDGGNVSTPVQGSFSPDGKWLPDGKGFTPDFEVEEDLNAYSNGRDSQMDKALEILKEAIRKDPPHWPKRLDPPSKEKAFRKK